MKQKIVIKVSMACDRGRSKALALVARADGVISMEIAGDARDRMEVVGDGVDTVCLASCLRRKLGHAEILQVEEVKDPTTKGQDEPTPQPEPAPPPLEGGYTCYHCCRQHPPPPMAICEEPSNCTIMYLA